jgi:CHAT domain-containing protein
LVWLCSWERAGSLASGNGADFPHNRPRHLDLNSLVSKGEAAAGDARTLGAALLDPVLDGLEPAISKLVVVPDGPLHRVPWDALLLKDGRWLVQRYAVSLAPSAGALALLWQHRQHPVPADSLRLLALGDPDLSRLRRTEAELFAAGGGLPALPGSRAEARLVARFAPRAELRLGGDASAGYLRHANLTGYEVVHFATHALVDDRALGRTALALTPERGESSISGSGLVTPGELARLRLQAGLVVLSGCRTAGGVVVDGEGIQGLTAPLLEAGARSVIATSWEVGDRSTKKYVSDLYSALASGERVSEASRTAKLAAISAGTSPRVWAAFQLIGDPTTVVPLTQARSLLPLWTGAAGIAFTILGVAIRRRRSIPRMDSSRDLFRP